MHACELVFFYNGLDVLIVVHWALFLYIYIYIGWWDIGCLCSLEMNKQIKDFHGVAWKPRSCNFSGNENNNDHVFTKCSSEPLEQQHLFFINGALSQHCFIMLNLNTFCSGVFSGLFLGFQGHHPLKTWHGPRRPWRGLFYFIYYREINIMIIKKRRILVEDISIKNTNVDGTPRCL